MIGQRLGGKYDIQSEIGRGGMGIVYRAYDAMLRRPVAVKVLAPQLAVDPLFLQRFEQEAVTAANLRHPNIVTIHDVGAEPTGDRFGQTIHYIVMELLDGVTLDQWLARPEQGSRVTLAQAEHIVRQVADALQYAHERGVIHRDVKPSNIMLNPAGRVTLMDFGLVRAGEGTGLTRSGLVVGTPEYMAPEQAMGGTVDGRTDIYSFGVVIYRMLAGQVPFARTTPVATAHAHVYETPPPIRTVRPDLPKPVEAVAMKALAKEPGQRYQQANDLAADFALAATGKIPAGLKASGAADRKATPTTAAGMSKGKRIPSTPKPVAATGPADPTRIVGAASATASATRAEIPRPRSPLRKPSFLAGLVLIVLALATGAVLLSLRESGATQPEQASKVQPPAVTAGRRTEREPTATLAAVLATSAPARTLAPPTQTAKPIPTPTGTAEATATPTATPVTTPHVVAISQADVRSGPGTAYSVVNSMRTGQKADLLARNSNGSWWQIVLADGTEGWVNSELVTANARTDAVPVAQNIAPPSATATSPPPAPATQQPTVQPIGDGLRVALDGPGPGERVTGQQQFSWRTSEGSLAPGQAFELRLWKPGQDAIRDGFGIAGTTSGSQSVIDLGGADDALGAQFEPGDFEWGVLLVQTSPYRPLRLVSEARRLVYERAQSQPEEQAPPTDTPERPTATPVP